MRTRFTVSEKDVAFGGPPTRNNLIQIYDSGKLVAKVICRPKSKSLEISIRTVNVTNGVSSIRSNAVFSALFGRTLGEELLARAYRWGQKKGLNKFYVGDTSDYGKALVAKAVESGIIDARGNVLKPLKKPIRFQATQKDLDSLNAFRTKQGLASIERERYEKLVASHLPRPRIKVSLRQTAKRWAARTFRRR